MIALYRDPHGDKVFVAVAAALLDNKFGEENVKVEVLRRRVKELKAFLQLAKVRTCLKIL